VARERGRILAIKWGMNPNSSSLGVDVTFLLVGATALAMVTPVIGALSAGASLAPPPVEGANRCGSPPCPPRPDAPPRPWSAYAAREPSPPDAAERFGRSSSSSHRALVFVDRAFARDRGCAWAAAWRRRARAWRPRAVGAARPISS
jgi:hypothetical protein